MKKYRKSEPFNLSKYISMTKKPENHMHSSVLKKPHKPINSTTLYLKKTKTLFSIILPEKPRKQEELKSTKDISILKTSKSISLKNNSKNSSQDMVISLPVNSPTQEHHP